MDIDKAEKFYNFLSRANRLMLASIRDNEVRGPCLRSEYASFSPEFVTMHKSNFEGGMGGMVVDVEFTEQGRDILTLVCLERGI